jgi:hypothetical protein
VECSPSRKESWVYQVSVFDYYFWGPWCFTNERKSLDSEEVVGVKYGVWEVDRYRSGS